MEPSNETLSEREPEDAISVLDWHEAPLAVPKVGSDMADHGAATPPSKLHEGLQVPHTVAPEHKQVPLLGSQVLPLEAHDSLVVQAQLEEQTCDVDPLHWCEPGEQTAPHVPTLMFPLTHAPALLHVCGVTPEHWVAPGLHAAPQVPAVTVPAPHAPLESHVCFAVPEHWVAPGLQAAPHCPAVTVPAPQVPLVLHVCFAVPEHWVVPGTQVPTQPLVEHAEFWQGTGVPQDPEVLHVWRLLPEQE
jgi:hypothetical protein